MEASATAKQGRQVVLATQDVPPPHCIYLTQDDQVTVSVTCSLLCRLRITARIIQPDGSLAISQWDTPTFNNLGIYNTITFPLSEGFLLSVTISNLLNSRRGQVYAQALLVRGNLFSGTTAQILTQGYVTTFCPVFWPDFQSENSYSGAGNIRSITGTTPAAGAEISETVPTGVIWRLITFKFVFQASAAAGNRTPTLQLDDGVNILSLIPVQAFVIANGVLIANFAAGLSQFTSPALTTGNAPLPIGNRLSGGFRIRTNTTNLQAGDQYSAVQYSVEEWLSL